MSNKKSVQIYFNLDNESDKKLYEYIMVESEKSFGTPISSMAKLMIYKYYLENNKDE